MVEISSVNQTKNWVKLLVYGDPGAGKTTFAASGCDHPDLKETLFLNIEGGTLSIRGKNVDTTSQLRSLSEVEEVFWSVANRKPGFEKYKTLIVDSGSELQTLNLEEIVVTRVNKNTGKAREITDLDIKDYSNSTLTLKKLFRQFRDLPCHVIITALAKKVFPAVNPLDPSKKHSVDPLYVGPQFTEQLTKSLMGYMDFVWYLGVKDNQRILLTQDNGPYKAKTRGEKFSQQLGVAVTNPNLGDIYNLLMQTEG
jgi:hypothetical protein